ncbi:MAG TPA: glutamate racemase [Micropepsaceae bacterium]|jgi:glutamate racemase|nr:glutamate racemase [Micropepsaceae bacterium]
MTRPARNRPIGVFDSGMGGLTVMRALMARLPHESFVYLGDTARLPYGSKSPDTVTRYAVQCARALMAHDIKLLVVACNTASATALPALTAALAPTPVIGVIEPGAQAAVAAAPSGRIAVIATEGTVKGGAYERAIRTRNPEASIAQQACPLFVALAEEGLTTGPIAELVARRYLDPLLAAAAARPECLVLGCTHFPALKDTIARVAGKDIALVDSAATTADAVARLLAEKDLASDATTSEPARFLATDAPDRFARVGEIFLGRKIEPDSVELVDLQRL